MIKYAFYILIGIFFVLGLNIAPGQELSGLQNEIEVRVGDTPQSVKSACILSSRTDNDCVRDTHSVFHDESSDYKVCDGILSSLSGSRNVAPFKLLKFNKPTSVIQILSALSVQLPEQVQEFTLQYQLHEVFVWILYLYVSSYSYLANSQFHPFAE